MAKPKKYPKKLRQTLERVREGKEPPTPDGFGYTTMAQTMASRWKATVILGAIDEQNHKLDISYRFLAPERTLGTMYNILAPWRQKVEAADLA